MSKTKDKNKFTIITEYAVSEGLWYAFAEEVPGLETSAKVRQDALDKLFEELMKRTKASSIIDLMPLSITVVEKDIERFMREFNEASI
jgi:predicted RNase H-like HicB family nuclease